MGFLGYIKGGPFDISGDQAREWLSLPANPKDSGRYKVANCTQAQPVFYGFAGLPDGKVILVSVLTVGRTPMS